MRNKVIDFVVGLFMLAGFLGLILLALRVSGLTSFIDNHQFYTVTAQFDNIGDLRVRAPVAVSGVTVGQVSNIKLDPATFRAKVTLKINNQFNHFPRDTAASILTEGLLGSNYISLSPGFDAKPLKSQDTIQTTNSALILENIIGQLMYSLTNGNDDKKK